MTITASTPVNGGNLASSSPILITFSSVGFSWNDGVPNIIGLKAQFDGLPSSGTPPPNEGSSNSGAIITANGSAPGHLWSTPTGQSFATETYTGDLGATWTNDGYNCFVTVTPSAPLPVGHSLSFRSNSNAGIEYLTFTIIADPIIDPTDPLPDAEVVEITSHCELAKSRLIAQLKGKPRIEAELCIWADQIQEIEQVLANILGWLHDIDKMVGVSLDRFGALVGWSRHGLIDSEYRLFLKSRIKLLASNGGPDEMISILTDMASIFAPTISYRETWEGLQPAPAGVRMNLFVPAGRPELGDLIAKMLKQASSTGVNFMLEYQQADTAFFAFNGNSDPNAGTWGDSWAHKNQGFSGYSRTV